MTVEQLIEILNQCPPDSQVLLAMQPEYPLQFELAAVAYQSTDGEIVPGADCEDDDSDPGIVYLACGESPKRTPYAPAGCWEV